MSLDVVSIFRPTPRARDWNNQELAEFYRVEASMIRGGVPLDTERGLSDEGDPWFIFCNRETGDVIIHFARIDGFYVVASAALKSAVRGRQFRPLIESLIDSHPVVVPKSKSSGKFVIHPAALLVALVTICFYKLGQSDAVAAEIKQAASTDRATALSTQNTDPSKAQTILLNEQAAAALLGVIAAATSWSIDGGTSSALALPPFPAAADAMAGVTPVTETSGLSALATNPGSTAMASVSAITADDSGSDTSGWSGVLALKTTSAANVPVLIAQKIVGSLDNSLLVPVQDTGSSGLHIVLSSSVIAQMAQSANESAASSSSNSATTDASHEIVVVLGSSAQTHLVTDLSGTEQKLVLSAAVAAATSSNSQTPTSTGSTTTSTSTGSTTTSTSTGSTTTSTGLGTSVSLYVTADTTTIADVAIQQFVASHPDFQMLMVGRELVLYDPHLTSANLSTSVQETLTFADGSSVFLIGIAATAHATTIVS